MTSLMALPPIADWTLPLMGLGYLALGVRWLYLKVREGTRAERERQKLEITESTDLSRLSREDAINLAELRGKVITELREQLVAKDKELDECRESGARIGHSYFELQGRVDEIERRLLGVERSRTRKA